MSEVGKAVSENAAHFKREVEVLGGELIAVSKTFSEDHIREAHSAGIENFGENYLNEAVEKINALNDLNIKWHFVGRLQKGTMNKVINRFYMIHTLAKLSHLNLIDSKSVKPQKVLLQIKHPQDSRDYGLSEDQLDDFVGRALQLNQIELCGLMFLPPPDLTDDELKKAFLWAHQHFARLRPHVGSSWNVMSMGMSGDYKMAIENGSTHVRVGRAIFGEREKG